MEYYFEIEHEKKKISGQGNFNNKKELVRWIKRTYLGCVIKIILYLTDIKCCKK